MFTNNIWNDVPQGVHNKVLETLDLLENKKRTRMGMCIFYKVTVACLVIICVAGVTACAAEVIHAYKERMTEMNRQQLEEYYNAAFPCETISYSRDLTKEERKRFDALKEVYITDGVFPKGTVKYLEKESDYKGRGVALHVKTGILYIPDKELKDEEMLQIIDFFQKIYYSTYILNEERKAAEEPWLERMHAMTDEEVDKAYITMYTGQTEVSGAFNRKLSDEEEIRYNELISCYEEENRIPASEIIVIEMPEEYTGETVAICRHDSTFYLPERILTDEEFLEIIDMNHKASYSIGRIGEEIRMGFRTWYPGYEK